MKIAFTGAGTGGHFYPIIAVAQQVNEIIDREHTIGAKLYYISDSPYDPELLKQNELLYEKVGAGKLRTYFSLRNFSDIFKIIFGTLGAIFKMFSIYPDVVFGKGGYASFPAVFAAWLLHIPVLIHESDAAPGRVNKWAGHFAKRIAVSFPEAAESFPPKRTAWTGQPIRREIEQVAPRLKALEYWKLEEKVPTVVILGGSQGAELINNTVLAALPRLVENYQVIHQTGIRNFQTVAGEAEVVLENNKNKSRYQPQAFLNALEQKMAAGAASIIVSRAGSTLFEIAAWGVPSILVPFTKSNANHSKKNAFSYARAGAGSVVEEMNMTANILCSEIERILSDKEVYESMKKNAKAFHHPGAAEKVARELINIALGHEK